MHDISNDDVIKQVKREMDVLDRLIQNEENITPCIVKHYCYYVHEENRHNIAEAYFNVVMEKCECDVRRYLHKKLPKIPVSETFIMYFCEDVLKNCRWPVTL